MAGSRTVEKMQKMGGGATKLSALEVAVLGRRLAAGDSGQTAVQMDAADEDWKQLAKTAKAGGPGSWFASKIEFSLNGAQFSGKVGYSVTGGVVPLFDGAAVDLLSADLKGLKPGSREAAKETAGMTAPAGALNLAAGTGGLLVLAPVGTDNAVPVQLERMIVTEKGLLGEGRKAMAFRSGDREVHADRIETSDEIAVLYGVSVREGGEDKSESYQDRAVVTGGGLSLFAVPNAQETGSGTKPEDNAGTAQDNTQAPPKNTDAGSTDTQQNNAGTPQDLSAFERREEDEGKGFRIAKGTAAVSQEILGGTPLQIGEQAEDEKAFRLSHDAQTGTTHVEKGFELADSEEGGDPLWTEFLKAGKEKLGDFLKEVYESDEKRAVFETFVRENAETVSGIMKALTSEEFRNNWAAFPQEFKELAASNLKQDDMEEYLRRLLPIDLVETLVGKKTDEEKASEDQDDSLTLRLGELPLFPPFLSLVADLTPGYKFGLKTQLDLFRPYDLLMMQPGGRTELSFGADIVGGLSLKAAAGLEATAVPFLLSGNISIYGRTDLGGGDTALGTKGQGGLAGVKGRIPLERKRDGSIGLADDLRLSGEANLALTGSVGMEGKVQSKILNWEHEVFSEEFKKWNLAEFQARLAVRRSADAGGKLWKGWSLDEASIGLKGGSDGLLNRFLEKHTSENRYGLYEPDPVPDEMYRDASQNFDKAVELLEMCLSPGAGDPTVLIPKDPRESGLSASAAALDAAIGNIQATFTRNWAEAQSAEEALSFALSQREHSRKYNKEIRTAERYMKKHEARILALEAYGQEPGTQSETPEQPSAVQSGTGGAQQTAAETPDTARGTNESARTAQGETAAPQSVLAYYQELTGTDARGYLEAVEAEAKEAVYSSYEAIVAYEQKRYREATEKHAKRIAILTDPALQGDQEKLIEAYQNAGGTRAYDHRALSRTAGDLLEYEKGRLAVYQKSSDERAEELIQKQKALEKKKKLTPEQRDQQFCKYYSGKLSDEEALCYGTPQRLIDYEAGKCRAENAELFDQILELESRQQAADAQAAQTQQPAGAQTQTQGTAPQPTGGQTQGTNAQVAPQTAAVNLSEAELIQYGLKDAEGGASPEIYKAASAEELMQIELQNVLGEEGQALRAYLDAPNRAGSDRLSAAFVTEARKKAAQERFGGWLENKFSEVDVLPYLTIELMLEHVEREFNKKSLLSEKRWKQRLSAAKAYLIRGRMMLEGVPGDQIHAKETEYLSVFAGMFSDVLTSYKTGLKEGTDANLELMLAAFSETPEGEAGAQYEARMAMLRQAKEENWSGMQLFARYTELGGDTDRVSEAQEEKMQQGAFSLQDALRYKRQEADEELRGRRRSGMKNTSSYYARYEMLKEMKANNAGYAEMLEAYLGPMAAKGTGLAEQIKKEIAAGNRVMETASGQLETGKFTIADIINQEAIFKQRLGKKHQDRIAMIESMQGRSDFEIQEAYEKQVASENGATLLGRMKSAGRRFGMEFRSGYEKSLAKKKVQLTPADLLRYEEYRMEQVGGKHARKLRALLGKDSSAGREELLEAPLPAGSEAEAAARQERVAAYREGAKQYKKDRSIREQIGQRQNEQIGQPEEALRASILAYETKRRDLYKEKFDELNRTKEELREHVEELRQMGNFYHDILFNLREIRERPEAVKGRLESFKKAAAAAKNAGAEQAKIASAERETAAGAKQVGKKEQELARLERGLERHSGH